MAYVSIGFGLGVLAAVAAFFSGAGVAMISLAYIGTGCAVLLSALVSEMMFDETPDKIEEDPLLLS